MIDRIRKDFYKALSRLHRNPFPERKVFSKEKIEDDLITSIGDIVNDLGYGSWDNAYFVHSNGFAGTPEKGSMKRAYQTLEAGVNAAAGELVIVLPGTYTLAEEAMDGMDADIYCMPGVVFNGDGDGSRVYMVNDTSGAVAFSIRGHARFNLNDRFVLYYSVTTGSNFYLEAKGGIYCGSGQPFGWLFRNNAYGVPSTWVMENTDVSQMTGEQTDLFVFLWCGDVTLRNCSITSDNGAQIEVRNDTGDTISMTLINCKFLEESSDESLLKVGAFSPTTGCTYNFAFEDTHMRQTGAGTDAGGTLSIGKGATLNMSFRGTNIITCSDPSTNEAFKLVTAAVTQDIHLFGDLYLNKAILLASPTTSTNSIGGTIISDTALVYQP